MVKSTQGTKPMPPELVEELSTLLADALVADIQSYPDLNLAPGGDRKARAQQSSRSVPAPSSQRTSSATSAAPTDDPADRDQSLPPAAHRPFLDALAELIASKAIRRSRSKKEIPEKTGHTPQVESRRSRVDQGQKGLRQKARLLTINEAARYLAIRPSCLREPAWRIKNGLAAVQIGRMVRFDIQMLDEWIERHRERLSNDTPRCGPV